MNTQRQPNSIEKINIIKKTDSIWIASFDIGSKNLCFCIEEYPININIKLIDYMKRYNIDGTPTELFNNQLKEIYKFGKLIFFENKDITDGCNTSESRHKYFNPLLYNNMYKHLDTFKEYWNLCDHIVIEEQMWSGINKNTKACRLEQHALSYFIYFYSNFKNIQSFPAYHKTQVLGAHKEKVINKTGKIRYKSISKPERKKWSIVRAKEILEIRKDLDTLDFYNKKTKRKIKLDDISDTILQCISYVILNII